MGKQHVLVIKSPQMHIYLLCRLHKKSPNVNKKNPYWTAGNSLCPEPVFKCAIMRRRHVPGLYQSRIN
jgi:hypothetical protein